MKKVLLILFSLFVLFVLVSLTFLSKNTNSSIEVSFEKPKNGNYILSFENDTFSYDDGYAPERLNVNYLNPFDKVLYLGDFQSTNENLTLGKGIYLISISELNSKYKIKGNGFEINNDGPINLYIDTTGNINKTGTETLIFSQNGIAEVKLIDENSSQAVNTVYLYPNLYIAFTAIKNKNVENADIFKLSQWFPIDNVEKSIVEGDDINPDFISKITSNEEQYGEIIGNMFLYLVKTIDSDKNHLSLFEENDFGTASGENIIKEYGIFLLNDSKKVVYYKNYLFGLFGDLIDSEQENNAKIESIVTTLEQVKSLNESDYEEIKDTLLFYSAIIVSGNDTNSTSKINFSKLYNSIINKPYSFNSNHILDINKTYNTLGLKLNQNEQKYNNMYSELNNIIKEITTISMTDNQESYLVLFLNKTIISGFNLNVDVLNIINIFKEYTEISLNYYNKENETLIRTGIAEYSKVISELLGKIRHFFFQADRTSDGHLVLNKENTISSSQINSLETNLNKIFKFFDDKQDILWDKEKGSYVNSFSNSKKLAGEYFQALKNYTLYILDFSPIFEDNNDDVQKDTQALSVDAARSYLSKFNNLKLTKAKISLRNNNYCNNPNDANDIDESTDPVCYKIENMVLDNGVTLNFLLFPNDYNKITNIVIDGDANLIKGTYRLDREEESWNTDKTPFADFFYVTFGNIQTNVLPDDEPIIDDIPKDNEEVLQESTTVRILKNRLISKGGDLYNVGPFLTILFNDVVVVEQGGNFDITVNQVPLKYNIPLLGTTFNGRFTSKYLPSPDNAFVNPEITFYGSNNNPLLLGNKIHFNGTFKASDIEKSFHTFSNSFNNLSSLVYALNHGLGISNMNIVVNNISDPNDKKASPIEIQITADGLELTTMAYMVKTFTYNGEKIISGLKPIQDVVNLLVN